MTDNDSWDPRENLQMVSVFTSSALFVHSRSHTTPTISYIKNESFNVFIGISHNLLTHYLFVIVLVGGCSK